MSHKLAFSISVLSKRNLDTVKVHLLSVKCEGERGERRGRWIGAVVQAFKEGLAHTNSESPEKGELLKTWQAAHKEKEGNNSSFTLVSVC